MGGCDLLRISSPSRGGINSPSHMIINLSKASTLTSHLTVAFENTKGNVVSLCFYYIGLQVLLRRLKERKPLLSR